MRSVSTKNSLTVTLSDNHAVGHDSVPHSPLNPSRKAKKEAENFVSKLPQGKFETPIRPKISPTVPLAKPKMVLPVFNPDTIDPRDVVVLDSTPKNPSPSVEPTPKQQKFTGPTPRFPFSSDSAANQRFPIGDSVSLELLEKYLKVQ